MKLLLSLLVVLSFTLDICLSQSNKNGITNSTTVAENKNKLVAEYKNIYFGLDTTNQLTKLSDLLNKITMLDPDLVHKCNVCNGTRRVKTESECSVCTGSGSINCFNCHNGQSICTACNGFGKEYCSCAYKTPIADLLGQFRYNPNCNVCGGNYGGRGYVICSNCNGNQRTECRTCQGTSQLNCKNCRNGQKSIIANCDACKGLGRLIE